jgi:hypothetical protein
LVKGSPWPAAIAFAIGAGAIGLIPGWLVTAVVLAFFDRDLEAIFGENFPFFTHGFVVAAFALAGGVVGYSVERIAQRLEMQEQQARHERSEREYALARDKRAAEQARADVARRSEHQALQLGLDSELKQNVTETLKLLESLPVNLQRANEQLDTAEQEFARGAFSPFWNAVETAVNHLRNYEDVIRVIRENSNRHDARLAEFEASRAAALRSWGTPTLCEEALRKPPLFPVVANTVRSMHASTVVAERLTAVVRPTETNFQFTSVFEMRKGFTALAHTIRVVGGNIQSSIETLGRDINRSNRTVVRAIETLDRNLKAASEEMRAEIQELNLTAHSAAQVDRAYMTEDRERHEQSERADRAFEAEARVRQEKVVEMLDNLQRRRTPWPPRIDDGQY